MANARIEIARRIAAVITVVLGIALTGFCATVENVRGSQRENSNLVDVYYDLSATDGGTYTVEVAIEGRSSEVSATTFSGDVGEHIAPGKNRHIVWEAGIDWRGNKGDVKAVVTATVEARKTKPKKVQLWEGGPYWADRNVGANAPWESGLYFWWGETTGHRPLGTTFDFSFKPSNCPTYGKSWTELEDKGWMSSIHDAAHVKWGGNWRMPANSELSGLKNNCIWTWTTMNGVKGCIVRGRGEYASKSIFLPAAGCGKETLLNDAGLSGEYWSSSPARLYNNSFGLYFSSSEVSATRCPSRYFGLPIRPVQ